MMTQDREGIVHDLTEQIFQILHKVKQYSLKPCDFKDYMQSIVFITEAIRNINKIS